MCRSLDEDPYGTLARLVEERTQELSNLQLVRESSKPVPSTLNTENSEVKRTSSREYFKRYSKLRDEEHIARNKEANSTARSNLRVLKDDTRPRGDLRKLEKDDKIGRETNSDIKSGLEVVISRTKELEQNDEENKEAEANAEEEKKEEIMKTSTKTLR